ncbi:MAG: hypothetical protein WA435_03330 [Gallionellaceae bacterium]
MNRDPVRMILLEDIDDFRSKAKYYETLQLFGAANYADSLASNLELALTRMPLVLDKLEVATRQLDASIRLFLEGDYLSSLTLAGVAEDILERLSERVGLTVPTEETVAHHFGDTDLAQTDKERRKVLLKAMNGAKNAAKHVNDTSESYLVFEQFFPLHVIMCAMLMARSLGLPPSRVKWTPIFRQ